MGAAAALASACRLFAPAPGLAPRRTARRHLWLTAAAVVAAAATVLMLADRGRRRQLLRRGALRELRSVWVDVVGCRVHARVADAAAACGTVPVVLVHGWGISGVYFIPAAERLAVEVAVYAPDLPGHGRSSTPVRPLDVAGLAQALVRWMDAMGIGRAALIGHSLGCQIVVEAALRHPTRVDRLVLIGPTTDPAARNMLAQLGRFLLGGAFESPSLNRYLVQDYVRMGRRLVPEFRAMLDDPVERKLPEVAVPVMLVRGQHDTIVPQRWLDQAARLLATDRVAVVPHWGHAVQYGAPERLVAAIRPFLMAARAGSAQAVGQGVSSL